MTYRWSLSLLRCRSSGVAHQCVSLLDERQSVGRKEFISRRRLREEVTSLFFKPSRKSRPIFWRNVCQHSMTDMFPRVPADNLRPVVQSSCQCHLMFFHHLLHNLSHITSSDFLFPENEAGAWTSGTSYRNDRSEGASGSCFRFGRPRRCWRHEAVVEVVRKKIWPELKAKRSQCAGMWRNGDGALFVTLRYESQLAVSSYTYSVKELRNCT